MMRPLTRSLAVLTLTLAALGCSSDEPTKSAAASTGTQAEAPPLPADVQQVGAAATPATTDANTGTVVSGETPAGTGQLVATGEFVSPVRSELAPKMPGRVGKLYVDEGSRVERGQPVLQLESDYLRLNLQAAEAEVARTRAAMNEAARDLQRKKELLAKNAIPKVTYDRSEAAHEQFQAANASAAAQAALLRQQIADTTLRSPVSGVVAEKRTDVGARLGDGGIAFVVVQLSPIKLRFQVPERYLGKLERGDTVTAKVDPYPSESFNGTIKTIGGVIDPRTRTMFAEAEFPNRDGRLRPGLFARVEVKLD